MLKRFGWNRRNRDSTVIRGFWFVPSRVFDLNAFGTKEWRIISLNKSVNQRRRLRGAKWKCSAVIPLSSALLLHFRLPRASITINGDMYLDLQSQEMSWFASYSWYLAVNLSLSSFTFALLFGTEFWWKVCLKQSAFSNRSIWRAAINNRCKTSFVFIVERFPCSPKRICLFIT